MSKKTIAIVGATGAVGQQMLQCLEERKIDCNLKLLASARSKGKVFTFMDQELIVEELTENSFEKVDYALGATENDITKSWMPWAQKAGTIVVDNSSAYRLDPNVPLVIPEINSEDIQKNQGIIANPNCATIGAVMALCGIEKNVGLKSVAISTYQSLSGAGQLALDDRYETNPNRLKKLDFVIDNNLIPYIGKIDDKNFCVEEKKIIYETKKILHDKNLFVMSQTVRVPIDVCHGESIFFETKNACDIKKLKQYIVTTENVKYVDFAMPVFARGKDDVLVSRLKQFDETHFSMFVVVDNIRKGAAQNGVEILIKLLGREYV